MAFLGVIHPPAGANPIIIILGGYGWSYLLTLYSLEQSSLYFSGC